MANPTSNPDLVAAFEKGYEAALSLVEAECERPALQRLTLRELAVMLRRQLRQQSLHWQRS